MYVSLLYKSKTSCLKEVKKIRGKNRKKEEADYEEEENLSTRKD